MKITHLAATLFVVAATAMMITDAVAQGGGGRGRGGPGGGGPGAMQNGDAAMVGLLMVDKVREELGLEKAQVEALAKIRSDNRAERPDFDMRSASPEERTAFFEKMQKQRTEQMEKIREQLEEVLLPNQMSRLEEIALQVRGVSALSAPDIQSELGITKEQKEKLENVNGQVRDKMREAMQNAGRGDRDAMRETFAKVRKEIEKEAMDVLTTEQRSKLDKMKGKAFEMPEQMGGFGRGGMMGGRGERGGERGGNRGGRGERRGQDAAE